MLIAVVVTLTMVEMVMKNVIDDGAGVDIEYQRFNFVTGYSRCVLISQTVKISEYVKHKFRGKKMISSINNLHLVKFSLASPSPVFEPTAPPKERGPLEADLR